jgi:hypothetical protein
VVLGSGVMHGITPHNIWELRESSSAFVCNVHVGVSNPHVDVEGALWCLKDKTSVELGVTCVNLGGDCVAWWLLGCCLCVCVCVSARCLAVILWGPRAGCRRSLKASSPSSSSSHLPPNIIIITFNIPPNHHLIDRCQSLPS